MVGGGWQGSRKAVRNAATAYDCKPRPPTCTLLVTVAAQRLLYTCRFFPPSPMVGHQPLLLMLHGEGLTGWL